METICINAPEYATAIVTSVVAGASMIANFVPEPAKIENPVGRFISRLVHFVALDVITGAKKK